ncbi:hypothetical protein [Actinomadura rudentiformis]|uniref:hypothetical protein n=1 Tax=Actinomadura rudentiformis TaxID=359158 RepID=UPI00178C7112|nr:hypothetical protein [Actinomadura rudentiformis]
MNGPAPPTSASEPSCPAGDSTNGGTDTEMLTWLDDQSRYGVAAHARVTGQIVCEAASSCCGEHTAM